MRRLLAVELHQLADALLVGGARVDHLGVVAHEALVDAEQVDPPGERVGPGLEHVGEEVLRLVGLEHHLLEPQPAVLDRRREVLHEGLEQPAHPEVAGGDAAGHREQVAVVGAVLEGVHHLLVGELLALQVALHEGVGVLGHLVHELVAVLLGPLREVVGDRDLPRVAPLGGAELVGLHVDQVDQPPELVLGADRDLGGHHVGPERRLQRLQRPEEVGPLAVEHVHEHQAREVELLGALPQARGAHLHAHDRVDHEHGGLAHAQGAERVGHERRVAGRVDEVDLAALPLEGPERRRDRHLPALLVIVGVRDGRAVDHRPKAVDRPRLEQQRLEQRRLTGAAMPDERDVANLVGGFHTNSPLSFGADHTEATTTATAQRY